MRAPVWTRTILMAGAVGMALACDSVRDLRDRDRDRLSLSLEAPEMLDWGGSGTIRVAIQNQGGAAVEGATIELHVPAWLEFASVEPPGTEVTLVSGEAGTRLSYRTQSPLQPGERRMVIQHVRVPAAAPAGSPITAPGDTTEAARPAPPTDRLLRARLVDERGAVLGAEVQAVLAFRGAAPLPLPDTAAAADLPVAVVMDDRVGTIRVGMSAEELRQQAATARDTTLIGPGGAQERAMVVPLAGGRSVAAVLAERGVHRIVVRDPTVRTAGGLGIGSRLSELRSAYGQTGCVETANDLVAVWFTASPGIRFGLSARTPADTAAAPAPAARPAFASLPDTARVVEIQVHEPRPQC